MKNLLGFLFVFTLVSLSQHFAVATEVMYARSNGDWQEESRPGRFSALNLLDGNPKTVWCSEGNGKDAWIEIQLDEPVDIEKIVFVQGNQSGSSSFRAFSRVKKIEVTAGDELQAMDIRDVREKQTLVFDPEMNTDRLRITLKAGYRGKKSRHTCISDIIIYKGRRKLIGKKIKKEIIRVGKSREFMDAWVSGPELNKTHLLVFGLGNRYRLEYVPLDPTEESVKKTGEYRIVKGHPELKVDKDWVQLRVSRDDAGRLMTIEISGLDALDGDYIRRSAVRFH